MIEIDTLNSALFRPIKENAEYDNYFEKVSCKSTYLGSGNTTFSLKLIQKWVQKYNYQTKKIAKQLKGSNTVATAKNIYNFLYEYFQYHADGYQQNIKSPACSWKTRKQGIDCKSYSLIASSLLTNLKIPHKLRKVTQPVSPDVWSHVYVVIPLANKEIIIDGTLHENIEVPFVKKEDLFMSVNLPHHGLNAPLIKQRSYNEDSLEAVMIFQDWLSEIENISGNKEVSKQIQFHIRKFLDVGIDPEIKVSSTYIEINGFKLFFNPGLNGFFDTVTKIGSTGGSLGAVTGLFSGIFGAEDPAKVKERFQREQIIPLKNKIQKRLSSLNKNNVVTEITDIDRYLSGYIQHELIRKSGFKSRNSKNAAQQVVDAVTEMLGEIRTKFSKQYTPTNSSESISKYGYKDILGRSFKTKGEVSYNTYISGFNPFTKTDVAFDSDTFKEFNDSGKRDDKGQLIVDSANSLFNDLFGSNSSGVSDDEKFKNFINANPQFNNRGAKKENDDKDSKSTLKTALIVGGSVLVLGTVGYLLVKKNNN